jgi:hypothetical protein
MSLQLAAQHMASRGRGPDTMLVHMAPSEVNALQTVAKAHGGSLTLNPDTGLPEAGFLSSILPMIAGVGLTALSGGTLTPVMAGLLTGGGTALATGNLQKGLMAGLGAYGGAGIGSSLATAGGNALTQEALLKANPGMNAIDIAQNGAGFTLPEMSMTDKMMAGVKGLGSEAGRDMFMQSIGGAKGLFKSGASAALPVIMAGSGETASPPPGSGKNPYEYDFTPGYTGPVRTPGGGIRFFDPRFVLRRAEGGETYADGGNTGMTGESDEYYRYLMGLAPMPTAYVAPVAAPAATQADTAPLTVTNPMAARRDVNYSDPGSMAFDDPNNPQNPNSWGNLTPMQQAAFYAGNPGYAKATQLMQAGFALTPMGRLQAAMVPNFVLQQGLIAKGLDPATGLPPGLNLNTVPVSIQEGMMSGLEGIGPNLVDVPASVQEGMLSGLDGPTDAAGQPGVDIGAIGPSIGDAVAGISNADVSAAADAAAAAEGDGLARGGLSSLAAFARGGYNLGDYSDGGRLLRGPGDGVSDSIPASIGNKRPARLADGEFVVPARIVSELGNGSTEAGARKLYAMMDRVQKTRGKTTGKGRVAVNSRSDRYLPA